MAPAAKTAPKLTRKPVVSDAANVVLGETYTDSVTGIKGVAIIVYVHLTGCDQVCLSFADKDGKRCYETFDATRLKELRQVAAPRRGPDSTGVPTRGPGRPTRDGA